MVQTNRKEASVGEASFLSFRRCDRSADLIRLRDRLGKICIHFERALFGIQYKKEPYGSFFI